MTVFLDEEVARTLKWRLIDRDLEVVAVPKRGWSGVGNGLFLARVDGEFSGTVDDGSGRAAPAGRPR